MSNFKLTFKLKQNTPLIHFHHDQHGATLRATELKPKLDRFLNKKFKKEKIGLNVLIFSLFYISGLYFYLIKYK